MLYDIFNINIGLLCIGIKCFTTAVQYKNHTLTPCNNLKIRNIAGRIRRSGDLYKLVIYLVFSSPSQHHHIIFAVACLGRAC